MEPEKKSNGALLGLIFVLIILIIGGIYMWQVNKNSVENVEEIPAPTETTVTTEDSADLDTLDKDLDTADIDLDANAINSVQ